MEEKREGVKNKVENTTSKGKNKYVNIVEGKKMEKEKSQRTLTACVFESHFFRFSSTQLV